MFRLALRTLRFRLTTFTAAFVAMFFAAAIIMGCGGLMETGVRTNVASQQLAGADVVVAGDQTYELPKSDESALLPERVRVDENLVDTIAAVPGVDEASSHVFGSHAPDGTVDAVGVTAEPGADLDELRHRIDAAVGDVNVVTLVGDDRGVAELPEALTSREALIALAGVFGGWAVVISVFGVASMLALSIRQRMREMALLRTVGATPGQLRRMVVGETLVLSVVATALAYPLGQRLGRFLFDRMVENGVVLPEVQFRQGLVPTLAAAGAALLAALGGALVAGRRAAATRPTQALAEVSLENWPTSRLRMLFALLFIGGGVALSIVTVNVLSGPVATATAGPAVFVWAIGLALLSPVLTKAMIVLLQWPLRLLSGLSGRLAVLNVKARPARVAAIVSPIVMLVGVATGTLYLQTTNDQANQRDFVDGLVADAVVTSTTTVDPEVLERVGATAGVAAVSEHVRSIGFIEAPHDPGQDEEGWTLQGVTAAGAAATTPVAVSDGSLTELHGETIALSADHAEELGVGLGDQLTLRLGDNAVLDLTVVTLFTADGYDTLLLPADVLAAHTTAGGASEFLVVADPRTSSAELVTSLEAAVADDPELTVADREAVFEEHADQQRTAAFVNYTLVIMIVAYAAISVVNTVVSSTSARRREFGLHRLTGASRGQLVRMIGLEGVLVAVVGVALGTVAALAALVPFSEVRLDSTAPSGSPLIYAVVVGTALALTLGASVVPGWRAMRATPAEAAVALD